ncbi:MAG: YkgJ family cysteine cluster protein [Myxococcales bacterium]
MPPRLTPETEKALRDLYARTDALFEAWTCPGNARCCQFGLTGRQPELWWVEWALLERSLRQRPAPKKAGAPGDCPAFDPTTRRCRAYDDRPFGCRTHFCDDAQPCGKNPRGDIRALARDLATLAERTGGSLRLLPVRAWAHGSG